jgi:cellulose synthase/poly-beta-1,6-N-acetylglucosamine synthase-like glycosyltransferase
MDPVSFLNYLIAFFTLFVTSVFILIFLTYRNRDIRKATISKKTPLVSIIIPAYNESDYVSKCLHSVLSMDYPADKLDVIVVDDGSTDETYAVARAFERDNVRVFTKKNGGKGAALNFGISKAKGEFIATMDADSYPTKKTIRQILPYFDDPEVMAVTPAIKIRQSDSLIKEIQRVEYLLILFSRKILSFIDSVPVTPGPFSMFRATVFDKVGGFDEHNLVEDVEIALRIQAANYKIRSSLVADVYTEPPGNVNDLMKQRVRWQRGGIRNYWKYRFLIKPEYGDFGMYFVPLNFASLIALFLLVGLMLYSFVSAPYYTRYIWFDVIGLDVGLFTFIGAFVVLSSAMFLHMAVTSFENEKVRLRYLISFLVLYWFLTVGYNFLFVLKELRREKAAW